MCGRFVLRSGPAQLRAVMPFPELPNFPPRYNIAPTQPVLAVRRQEDGPHLVLMRWGFIPSWVKDPRDFPLLINARSETVFEKPAFRHAIRRRRCLLPADGFYEWLAEGRRKRPHYIARADGAVIGFAGVWETWMGPNGEELESVAILTTAAPEPLRFLHERVPVIVAPQDFSAWLDPRCEDPAAIARFLHAREAEALVAHEVGLGVNRVVNDDAALIAPITPQPFAEEMPQPKTKPAPRKAAATGGGEQGSLF